MDQLSLWKELCFLWGTDMPAGPSSGERELQILRGLEKLGWNQFAGHVGRFDSAPANAEDLSVDFVLCGSRREPLVAVFVGKTPGGWSAAQMASQMRKVNVDFGVLIADEVAVFFAGEPELGGQLFRFMDTRFDPASEEGQRFAQFFSRVGFEQKSFLRCLNERLNRSSAHIAIERMRRKLATAEVANKVLDLLRAELPGCREDWFLRAVDGFQLNVAKESSAEAGPGKPVISKDAVMLWGKALQAKIIPTSCNIAIAIQRYVDEEEIRTWESGHLSALRVSRWNKEFLQRALREPGGAECRQMLSAYKNRFVESHEHDQVPKCLLDAFILGLFKLHGVDGEKFEMFVERRFGVSSSGSAKAIKATGRGAGRVFGLLHHHDMPTELFLEYFEVVG